MEKRTNEEILQELLPIENADIVDVGCGDGSLVRWLTRRGAHVTGVEVSPRMLAKAQAVEHVGDESFIAGIAEDLPLPNRAVDIVIFFNSLHHVDAMGLAKAMREAGRVLRFGGIVYVSEPMAEGPYFELMRPAHDETKARLAAYQTLLFAPEYGFIREREVLHVAPVKVNSFEAFRDRITSINPHTRERFDENEAQIRENFDRFGEFDGEVWWFDQPMRVTMLRR